MGTVSKVIATCLALAAFAVSILAGLAVDNPASIVLGRSLIAMVVCYPIGLVIGLMCQRVIDWHVEQIREANPVPASEPDDSPSEEDEEVLVV